MQTILPEEFDHWEKLYRTRFFNSLHGYKAIHLIGSKNGRNEFNLAPFSSVVHVGAFPPLVGIVFRPNTVSRHTYDNIKTSGVFTINSMPIENAELIHKSAAKYPRNQSEFEAVGLDPEQVDLYDAPAVKGAPVQLFLKEVEEQLILANQTHFLIGEIYKVRIRPELVAPSGLINTDEFALATGLESYGSAKFYKRFTYARPDEDIQLIPRNE